MPKPRLGAPPIVNQEYAVVLVDKLKPHKDNPNRGDLGVIHESLDTTGFFGACIVQRSTNTILAGHHRWMAAKKSGMPELPVILVDVDDRTALKILLVDNQAARRGNNDEAQLLEILTELAKEGDLKGTGFDADDIDDLIANATALAPTGEEDGGVGQGGATVTCPACGHSFELGAK